MSGNKAPNDPVKEQIRAHAVGHLDYGIGVVPCCQHFTGVENTFRQCYVAIWGCECIGMPTKH